MRNPVQSASTRSDSEERMIIYLVHLNPQLHVHEFSVHLQDRKNSDTESQIGILSDRNESDTVCSRCSKREPE